MNAFVKDLIFRAYVLLPRPAKLVILDDYFPNMYQAYRVAEFNYYFRNLARVEAYTRPSNYRRYIKEYADSFPEFAAKVHPFDVRHLTFASLYYVVFLHNAYAYLPIIERDRTPFILNLYAGGFFGFNEPRSDMMLQRVCASPYLKQIVVSQKNIWQYILDKGYCSADRLTYIYGAVPSPVPFSRKELSKVRFSAGKATLDICFVAHKSMKLGKNKGFDVFVKTANQLCDLPDIRFHVLGEFTSQDTEGLPSDNIVFHPSLLFTQLPDFFRDKDIFISPNTMSVPYPFSVEGFPTGAAREAAYSGVSVFCTDPYQLNTQFTDRRDIVLIETDVDDIERKIRYYYHHPRLLSKIGECGQKSFRRVFNYNAQMRKRLAIIKRYL